MRKILLTLTAAAVALPMTVAPMSADARTYNRGSYYHRSQRCTHSGGTTGAVAGGVGGALAGRSVLGHGLLGTAAGAAGGFFAGRAIDRSITAHRRCTHYYR